MTPIAPLTPPTPGTAPGDPTPGPCPLCGAPGRAAVRQLHDDRFGHPGAFDVDACAACDHRWLRWRPSGEALGALYAQYYPRAEGPRGGFRPYAPGSRIAAWLSGRAGRAAYWVPRGVRVLDIGCGLGESLAYHVARGCDARGIEADDNAARYARARGLRVRTGLFDPTLEEPASFDYVTLDQVLEHVVDPVATLAGVRTVLRPGGRLVLATPNARSLCARVAGRRWINWHIPYHLQFFSAASLRRAAERAGLEVERVETRTSAEWLSYQAIHALTAPPRGAPSPFWAPAPRSGAQRALITGLRALHRTGIDHVVTRALDLADRGDSLLVHLRRGA